MNTRKNSTLVATSETRKGTAMDARLKDQIVVDLPPRMPVTRPGDLTRPKWGSNHMPARTTDTDAVVLRDLAREFGMAPLTLLAIVRERGEWVASITSKVPAPIVRNLRALYEEPLAEWERELLGL